MSRRQGVSGRRGKGRRGCRERESKEEQYSKWDLGRNKDLRMEQSMGTL